jgi:endonuclease G
MKSLVIAIQKKNVLILSTEKKGGTNKRFMKTLLTSLLWLMSVSLFSQQLPQKVDSNNQIREYNGYTLSYNESHEQANWVYYVLKPEDISCETSVKIKKKFIQDDSIATGTAEYKDYTYSGYDRGHLKPAGDEKCDSLQMVETYYMSNISPQNPSFNRGIWKKLENYTRKVAFESDSVVVITGPILADNLTIIPDKKNNVSIPEFFFKILYIYQDGKLITYSFLMKNEKSDEPLATFLVPIEAIENLAGLDF